MKRLIIVLAVAAIFLFSLSVPAVIAQPIDYCEGNFDNDLDQDGSDAFVFKSDFGRSSLLDPCPVIECQTAEQLEARIAQLEALLTNVTRVGNDITLSGVNVHIVDGSGDTYGAVNGLGNLIVGYNELRPGDNDRTGSHNIIVGAFHSYSSFGGLVAGGRNTISGPLASVIGGQFNEASGISASVSGGYNNQAIGDYSFVGGGGSADPALGNWAVGDYSAILGGTVNTAGDQYGEDSSIGMYSTVSGGSYNNPTGASANVSGGFANKASGQYTSVSGGQNNTANGSSASVSGGRNNVASGEYSFVGGGGYVTAEGGNTAFAHYSSVLGGMNNVAGDPSLTDHTIGQRSSVSGGYGNNASGNQASVSGGYGNDASGSEANVSGGLNRSAPDSLDWAAGSLLEDY